MIQRGNLIVSPCDGDGRSITINQERGGVTDIVELEDLAAARWLLTCGLPAAIALQERADREARDGD